MKRWIKISLIALVLLIGTGVILFDVILEGLLKTKLESFIQQQKDRIYDYNYNDIQVKFIAGDLILSNLKIIPRKDILDSLESAGIFKMEIYNIELKEFRLVGLESWNLLMNNEIYIKAIIFDNPKVSLYRVKNASLGYDKQLAEDIISPTLNIASIEKIEMINANFEVHIIENGDTLPAFAFDSADFLIKSIFIDSILISSGEIFTFKEVHFSLKNIEITSMKDYRFEIDEIHNEFSYRKVFVDGFRLSPFQGKYEFMRTQKYETDWFNIDIRKLEMTNFNVSYFQKTGKIDIESLLIDSLDIELYRDKRLPDGKLKFKPLPSRALRELNKSITIKEINITNAAIRYLEWEQNATQPIVVKFTETSVRINNLTTDDEKLELNDSLTIHISSTFMDYGKIKAELLFPVRDTTDVFFLSGRITNLPLASLNPIIHHSAFVTLEEGLLNYMEFDMIADDNYSHGNLDIDYSGLKKVQLMRNKGEMNNKRDKGKSVKEQKKFLSFLANTLIPNEYNPDSKNYYTGIISFNRKKEKAFFSYLVKSIQSGIITSLVPSKQENYHELKREKKFRRKKILQEGRKKKKDEKITK